MGVVRVQKQLNRHDPENGVYGDCCRTAYACLLNLDAQDVPHFGENGPKDFWTKETAWLRENMLRRVDFNMPASLGLAKILKTIDTFNPGTPFMLLGKSSNGVAHWVVCCEGKIVCDPSIDNSGIVGPIFDYYVIRYVINMKI